MSLNLMAERSASLFAKCFGHEPRWVVAAPGRVNLIGEHTDYNDGYVLPMAIERYMVMAADRNSAREVVLHSNTNGETATFSTKSRVERGEPAWSNYVRGVVAGFQNRGRKVAGFHAVIESTLPYGGGVASSAALEVAAATLLETINGRSLTSMDKALLCQQAEHDYARVPCGIMDQFTSVLATKDHALLLDCRKRTSEPVPMNDPELSVLVINTHVKHMLADGEYAKRRSECEAAAKALQVPALRDATLVQLTAARRKMSAVAFRRARHVITENHRTLRTARAIGQRKWQLVGELMYESHASLRDDYEVSCPELDTVVEIAKSIPFKDGMIGCRMTGAGFGGCAVSLVKTGSVKRITRIFEERFEAQTGNHAGIFSTRPAGGARVLKL